MRRLLATAAAALLTGLSLWWLLTDDVTARIGPAIATADPLRLGLAFLTFPVVQWLRAWRFHLLLRGDPGRPELPLLGISFRLVFFNFVLPFKLGELSFPVMARTTLGVDYAHSLGVLACARLLDLVVVGALITACAALLVDLPAALQALLIAVLALLLIFPPLAFGHGHLLLRLTTSRPRVHDLLERLLFGFSSLRSPPLRALVMGQTFLIWLAHALLGWLAASAVIRIGIGEAIFAAASSNLAFAIPATAIAGLGPPQAAWVAALDLTGLPFEAAVVSALTGYAVILTAVLAFGLGTFLVPAWLGFSPSRRSPGGSESV